MADETRTFSAVIDVRFADLDAYNHVNNATYFTYLETARVKLFSDKFASFMESGLLFFVVRAECDYKKPINLNDTVFVSMRASRFGNSSFDMDYSIHDGKDGVYATAKTVMACFDSNLGRTVPVRKEIIDMLK